MLGDFDPASSDIDLLAVTRTPVSGAEFAALSAVHSRVRALDNPYAAEVELAYVRAVARGGLSPEPPSGA